VGQAQGTQHRNGRFGDYRTKAPSSLFFEAEMGRRLNHEGITLGRKSKLSVMDEAEFVERDAAARWLEHADERNGARKKSEQPKRKNKTQRHRNF
jgi:hypothetical protein